MAINLASKYSKKVDERFSLLSVTENIGLNKDYDWNGVKTVTVYNIDTATMNNYSGQEPADTERRRSLRHQDRLQPVKRPQLHIHY